MSSTDCLRLFVLCFWLLVGDVDCENTQRGYVLLAKRGQTPMGVNNDNQDHKRLSETYFFKRPTAGYRMPSLVIGQSGYVIPAEEQRTIDSKSSQIESHYPVIPDTQRNKVNNFESGFNPASATQQRNNVMYNRSGHKAVAFPDGKISAGQFYPRIFRARPKSRGRFLPAQVDNAPVSLYSDSSTSPDIQAVKSGLKSESHMIDVTPTRHHIQSLNPQESLLTSRPEVSGYQSPHLFHNSFNHDKTNFFPKVTTNRNIFSTIKAHSPRSNSGAAYPISIWDYNSDVTSEVRGYANVRRLKPGFDKTGPQASYATGKKFSETGFPGFGPGVPASSDRQQNPSSRPSSWHPAPDRAQIVVQGKFKPFGRLDDLTAHTRPSDAPTQDASLNCTGTGEMSTNSSSPLQTEAPDTELLPQVLILEGQNESSAEVGPSSEQNKPLPDSPPKLQPSDAPNQEASLNYTGIGEMSTNSSSPMQTEAPDTELLPQVLILKGQTEISAEVGPSWEQNKPLPDSPPKLQLAEDRKGDTVVL
ncbi:uncharacterized protein LOC121898016 [Scomber scombrus]|uniref:Uncharacterized protein LOC121898016 n=1 Tax=Scomber scombrus TaxID=13677 RepID=A0AAV1PLM8_SCOSC